MAARRDRNGHGLVAVRVIGALLPPDFLQTIARLEAAKQSGADYGLSKSLVLKDEIARYWRIANDLYAAYVERRQRTDLDAQGTGVDEWLVPLFRDVLGYADISRCDAIAIDGQVYPITDLALDGTVPLLFTTRDVSLDRADARFGDEGRRRAPYGVVQELLNADDDKVWGVVSNGTTVRLLHDNPSLTRPAYIEADLERIFEEQIYADFSALWLTFHASRLRAVDGKPSACILEAWREQAHEIGERALEHLRDGVTEALRNLGNGFLRHPNNVSLREQLSCGIITPDKYFQELLRLIYRLLFLFTAEDRKLLLLPSATDDQHLLYDHAFSLSRFRERALRRRYYDKHSDLWRSVRILFTTLRTGESALALPGLGGLFAEDQCPNLDAAYISNADFLEALRALLFFRTRDALAKVNYRDMGPEELGSVYESLLELHPFIEVNTSPWTFGFVGYSDGGNVKGSTRKLTGSYYTPTPLVNQIVASTLEPIIRDAVARNSENPRLALLAIRVLDPACGSGHFLLSAARRIAAEIARIDTGNDIPDEPARQHALREVVQHCIYGVDRNPLAVELCKTALWIETVEPGKPLSFLDTHILCGDSLLGLISAEAVRNGIPDEAYRALTGDSATICRELRQRNGTAVSAIQGDLFDQHGFRTIADTTEAVDAMPEDTVDEINAKRLAWQAAQESESRIREELRANLFVGAFLSPKTPATASVIPVQDDLMRLDRGIAMRDGLLKATRSLTQRHGVFHWHVAFADIMRQGGFSVLMGNPPWERLKLQEQEFFATRSPSIANAPNKAERARLIKALSRPGATAGDKALLTAFEDAKHEAEATSQFVRTSGRYPLTGSGDVNTYALFAETFLTLMHDTGRAGFIVPTGIVTDDSTKKFFQEVTRTSRLVSVYDFQSGGGLFDEIGHARFKFSVVTLSGKSSGVIDFACYLRRVADLHESDRHYALSAADLALLSPNTRTAPLFRSAADSTLTSKIYASHPVLLDETVANANRAWNMSFARMFDMSNDSGLFRNRIQLADLGAQRKGNTWVERSGARWLPLYEAKFVHLYTHRWGTYESYLQRPSGSIAIPTPTQRELEDPSYEITPWYWVPENEVEQRLLSRSWKSGWLMGWRDVTNAGNERTMIAAAMPRVGANHKLPLFFVGVEPELAAAMLSNFSSLVFDYMARQKVGGTSLTYFYLKQLPVLPPNHYRLEDIQFIVQRVLELIYTSHEMAPLARDLKFAGPPFKWNPERTAQLRAELDAYVAIMYGLRRDELRFILDPSDASGPTYPSETFRVLRENEIKAFGEYRTARLVLTAWDALVANKTGRTEAAS